MIRTGEDYRQSIRDRRDVYVNGEKVRDVTAHPQFKPLVDIRARIYDMQHEGATRELCGGQIGLTPDAASFRQPDTKAWMEKYYTVNDEWVTLDRSSGAGQA